MPLLPVMTLLSLFEAMIGSPHEQLEHKVTAQHTICNHPGIFALYGERPMDLVHMSECSSLISLNGLLLHREGKVDEEKAEVRGDKIWPLEVMRIKAMCNNPCFNWVATKINQCYKGALPCLQTILKGRRTDTPL